MTRNMSYILGWAVLGALLLAACCGGLAIGLIFKSVT